MRNAKQTKPTNSAKSFDRNVQRNDILNILKLVSALTYVRGEILGMILSKSIGRSTLNVSTEFAIIFNVTRHSVRATTTNFNVDSCIRNYTIAVQLKQPLLSSVRSLVLAKGYSLACAAGYKLQCCFANANICICLVFNIFINTV